MKRVNILIADDHEAIRRGIRSLLAIRSDWRVCGEAVDGMEAVEKVMTLKPDVVLMDISMPRMDGLAATRIVHDKFPNSHVIIVTQSDPATVRAAGVPADGFVSKGQLARDLVPTIESVLQPRKNGNHSVASSTHTAKKAKVQEKRERFDTALKEAGEGRAGLLAAIVDSSDDAIISKDLDGIITSWNRAAERTFGYDAAEIVGQPITRIIPPDRQNEETEIIARLRRGERVDHFETVRMRKDGSLVEVSVTISPIYDSGGRIVGASKVARNITDQKRTEKELRESEQRLRALTETLESQVRERTWQLERRNVEILEQTHQLRRLSMRLQQGQDQERRRIARELHDSAGQVLAVLSLNFTHIRDRAGSDEIALKAIADSEQLVEQLNTEIRTMSYLLHPPLLEENGLTGAVQWYVKGYSERGGVETRLEISPTFGRLTPEMELALFRIVQECLTNIHRHSGSKTATIHLARDEKDVSLEIRDRGSGIAPDKLEELRSQRAGVGITGIRERVRQFNGAMRIDSSNQGTTIAVTLPLPQEVGSPTPSA
jgi:PAS domain S-box-containing protein